MDHATVYLLLAAAFGLFMAWGIGANDVANAMATSVGSKALTLKNAVIIAAIFEFLGAFLAGGQVTATIRKGIIDSTSLAGNPELLVFGMLAALLSAGLWLLIACRYGLPVSTTHSIIGAIVGFAIVAIGVSAVKWDKVTMIAASWVVSPVVAGVISYFLFRSVQALILDHDEPIKNAKKYVPVYIFLTGTIISLVTMLKGLKHIGLELSMLECYIVSFLIGAICMLIGSYLIKQIKFTNEQQDDNHFNNLELIFGVLMIFTACTMAFAHGSNDVANAVGPVAAVVSIVANDGAVSQESLLPLWVLFIVAGLLMYGHKVIATVGSKITDLTPSRGFCCNLAASMTVVVASGTGLPISTTHTLVGAVLGVGFARGISALNIGVIFFFILSSIFQ